MTTNRDEAYIERVLVLVKDKGQVKKALENNSVSTIGHLRNILRDPNKINALKWKNNQSQEKDVSTVFKRSLREMESFINYTQNRTRPLSMGAVDLAGITPDDYEDFVSAGLPSVAYDDARAQAAYDRHSKTSSSDAASRLALWNKYAIKNKDDFPYLSKAYEWVTFCKKFGKTAQNQGLESVLNGNYVPRSADEIELFKKQCTFIFTVLMSKVTLSEGKIIIQQFEDHPFCGQKAWTGLSDEYSKSMHGELRRKDLLGYITSTTIPEHPKQNLVTYMEEIQSWYCEYNELVPSSDAKMTPEAFVEFVYCFCQNVPSIKRLQDRNHWEKYRDSQSGNTQSNITPSMEIKMITDTLIKADADRLLQRPLAAQMRKQYNAYEAHVSDDSGNLYPVYDDTAVELSAHVAARGRAREQGVRLPGPTWYDLPSKDKTSWNGISGKSQIAIANGIIKEALEAMAQEKKQEEKKSPAVSFKSALPPPRAGLSLGRNPPVSGHQARTANVAVQRPEDIVNVGAYISELVRTSDVDDSEDRVNMSAYLDSITPSTSQLTEVEESSEDEARAHAQRMRDRALEQPPGSLIRTLSEYACDQTPVVPINQEDWSHSDYVTDESIEEKNGEKNGEQCKKLSVSVRSLLKKRFLK